MTITKRPFAISFHLWIRHLCDGYHVYPGGAVVAFWLQIGLGEIFVEPRRPTGAFEGEDDEAEAAAYGMGSFGVDDGHKRADGSAPRGRQLRP